MTEEVVIRRYHELDREEIRRMFKLHDIRKTRVWQEAHEEGRVLEKQKFVKILLAEGRTQKDIAKMLDISVSEVRRLAKR